MKIENLLTACLAQPHISLKDREIGKELILNRDHQKGNMLFIPILEGITLAFIDIHASTWPAPSFPSKNVKGPFVINYCIDGRCEMLLNNGCYVYVSKNQYSLSQQYAQNQYQYPNNLYQGIEIFVDFDQPNEFLQKEIGIDLSLLATKYCDNEATFIAPTDSKIESSFQQLWFLKDSSLLQMKLATLSLLALLMEEKKLVQKQCIFYTQSQVDIAKQAEKICTQDLSVHHSAKELAQLFSISETSLKNYFRAVFGQNISVYMKEKRMNKALELLEESDLNMGQIAIQVGYSNQSKFAKTFKSWIEMTPFEYRRQYHLKQRKV